ncbi:hypothetical protein CPB86DRAFT_793063 [Serendipita vermifera]|nr:hypothetical protein CPB86DRAFT_793063 [Serendipita vermifera]
MQTIYPQQASEVDYSSYRAILNLIKQRYRLDINYTDVVYGKANAHVWCGEWTFRRAGGDIVVIGTGESATRAGAKEYSAKPAVESLIEQGFEPPQRKGVIGYY